MGDDHKTGESVFNMGLAYLKRIDTLLNYSAQYSISGDLQNWFQILLALSRELAPFCDNRKKDIDDKVNKLSVKGLAKANVVEQINLNTQLHNLEIDLRILMKKKGLLLPSKNDPRFAVLERG